MINNCKPIILFRPDIQTEEEMNIAKKYFEVTTSRVLPKGNRLVIGRYSCLPYYKELETDLRNQESRLINSYQQHLYIANFEYYSDICDLTAETWGNQNVLSKIPKDGGPWIVKGRTNSRKQMWHTHMFAKTWEDLIRIYSDLSVDPIIGDQGIIVRKFLDLEVVEEGISQPFFNEWRFFFYRGRKLSHGFYWTCSEKMGQMDEKGLEFANRVAEIVKDKVNFVVIDIARMKNGEWKLIELNDGQQSGLSYNDPEELYSNLSKCFIEKA